MIFHKVLIANRGEIAARIARSCKELGIRSVAVYSDADRNALHVRACDEAYHIGPSPASESYLRGDKIIDVARTAHCQAIHPGYGFLSENADFARAVIEAGLTWIGPPPEAIALMGSKIESKRLAQKVGVPVVPGYFGDDQSFDRLAQEAERIGYPVLIKASAGGGGKGMRVVESPAQLRADLEGAQREALAAFGDGRVMLEKYLAEPRHIEIQVLGDEHGNLIHLGERECSIQRRHQKVVEEAPSPVMTDSLRRSMAASALALAKAASYTSAGTVEFIYQDGEYYFLEMNTRIQVEHPVTEEALLFVDLVKAQIQVAAGEEIPYNEDVAEFHSHAIEVRLYAEDPERGFLPATGKISKFEPKLPPFRVRVDAGVAEGDEVSPYYDPMIAKIVATGDSRQEALEQLRAFLGRLQVEGVTTNLDFLRWVAAHPQFEIGNISTRFIERYYRPGAFPLVPAQVALAGAAVALLTTEPPKGRNENAHVNPWQTLPWRQARHNLSASLIIEGRRYDATLSSRGAPSRWLASVRQGGNLLYEGEVELHLINLHTVDRFISGEALRLRTANDEAILTIPYSRERLGEGFSVEWEGREYWMRLLPPLSTERMETKAHLRDEDTLESPMPGKVLKLLISPGERVVEDQPLVIIEAMKMEFTVRAPHDGTVAAIHYKEGDQVAVGDVLVEMKHAEAESAEPDRAKVEG